MHLKLADVSAHERYKLLIGLVIPRPIAWISTWSENGVANCAPFSFFNVFSEDPPLCVIGINPRSDGECDAYLEQGVSRDRKRVRADRPDHRACGDGAAPAHRRGGGELRMPAL